MHIELPNFSTFRGFRYQVYWIELIILHNVDCMEALRLRKKDEAGNILSVIERLPMVRKQLQNQSFVLYIYGLMKIVYFLIHVESLPRVLPEYKSMLQLPLETSVGDWFIFERHTMILIDGFEGEPYMLPSLLTPRIFSLE